MKRRISKRIIAIGMSLCVAFSIMPLSVSAEAETAAPAVKQNNLWVSTGKTFVNRIYTVGLTTCGSALVRIAGATESEGFQKVLVYPGIRIPFSSEGSSSSISTSQATTSADEFPVF